MSTTTIELDNVSCLRAVNKAMEAFQKSRDPNHTLNQYVLVMITVISIELYNCDLSVSDKCKLASNVLHLVVDCAQIKGLMTNEEEKTITLWFTDANNTAATTCSFFYLFYMLILMKQLNLK